MTDDFTEEFVKRATVTGHVKPVKRLVTGLWSFDRAFVNNKDNSLGFPLGKLIEVWGPTHLGKSTIVYSLSGLIAAEFEQDISLADLEDFDPEFLIDVLEHQGFRGEIHSVLEEKDEKILSALLDDLQDNKQNFGVGILDAIGTIAPYGEREGEFGAANMGQRARLMGQFSRRAIYILRSVPEYKTIFMVNHQQLQMGGFGKGYKPPGGDTKGYLASIRIPMSRLYIKKQGERLYSQNGWQVFPDGSYCVQGMVQKNKWGFEGGEFSLFVLAGKGIHKGLTALLDGFMLGKVKRSRAYIKIGDETFGTMKEIIEKAQAGDDEFFQPFYDVLAEIDSEGENNEEN